MRSKQFPGLNPDSPLRYAVYLLLLLPAFIFRDFTPDNELKYLSIAEEAIRNNTWFTFYNHAEAYADKPPLYFWLIMLSRIVAGGYYMWLIGLFSLLPAVGIMAVMDRWMKIGRVGHNAVLSNLLLLTTAIFAGAALVIRMDMLMTFFIVLSLYTFFRIYSGCGRRRDAYLLPVYIFLAVFSKGAMGFLMPVASITAFLAVKKQLRTFGRYLGPAQWGILVGLCVAWFSMVYFEGGWEYLDNILFKQTVGRGVNSFHHKEPLWYYFPRMLWSFAPWVLLYGVLLWEGIGRRMFLSDTQKFFAATTAVNIVMLSVISAKLDIYMLPVYPFVVFLCSSFLYGGGKTSAVKIAVGIPAALFALCFPAMIIFGDKIPDPYNGLTMFYVGALFLSAGGAAALYFLLRGNSSRAIASIAFGMLLAIFSASFAIPHLNRHIGFREMAIAAKDYAGDKKIDRFVYYKFATASNMDVFLGSEPESKESVEALDSLDESPTASILFIRMREVRREPELSQWLNERSPVWTASEYEWYVIGGND